MPVTRPPTYDPNTEFIDTYNGNLYGKYGEDADRSFSTGSPMDRRGDAKKGASVQSQAPPTQSIYDLIGEPNTSVNESIQLGPTTPPQTPFRLTALTSTSSTQRSIDASDQFTPAAPRIEVHDRWITVFGFNPTAIPAILQQFQSYGEVIKVRHGPTNANWIHLQYRTKLQALKALEKNGRTLNGTLMIGVVPCTDKLVISGQGSSVPEPSVRLMTGPQKFRAASSEYSLDKIEPANAPQPRRSVWSNILTYVFGI
jgi:hypothetical protein